ncbi:MAG: 60 kDa SS-A/Ro ribonucleoprotein [bacterium]|jgi:60 kDa SS-A/Ro ribonucleoprotein
MANKSLFKSIVGKIIQATDSKNEAGGRAYTLTPKHALAQYVATGCLNSTYYASDAEQLEKVLKLCEDVDPKFIAQIAIYAREKGHMKDMPALLTALLSVKGSDYLPQTFDRVIDNGRMLRNFVQIMRSGVVGRKSLGSRPKNLVRKWLDNRKDQGLLVASVGKDPSLADIIKMVHPKPKDPVREAFYGYLIGKDVDFNKLPEVIQHYEAYKKGDSKEVPKVPFQLLTALDIGKEGWMSIAENARWQMTRMNLNTFVRHGVFDNAQLTKTIENRLKDPEEVKRARVFPYQLLSAFKMVDSKVPNKVKDALQDAMEIAIENVPSFDGKKVYVFPDVSGSMQSPVTGYRKGSTSAVTCVDVAALVAAAITRKNSDAEVLAFDTQVHEAYLNSRDNIMTNAQKLAKLGGYGTDCHLPLAHLNKKKSKGDLVIYVSDNESWADPQRGNGTAMMQEWGKFKSRNPDAKMVCIDIQPYGTVQAQTGRDILNVGGFSDEVFNVIKAFADGTFEGDFWIKEIEKVQL